MSSLELRDLTGDWELSYPRRGRWLVLSARARMEDSVLLIEVPDFEGDTLLIEMRQVAESPEVRWAQGAAPTWRAASIRGPVDCDALTLCPDGFSDARTWSLVRPTGHA